MATSTIFNFNFNNSEIVDSTGQWYNATTGTPTTEFIEHDGNTALLQRAYIAETSYTRDINPVFFQSRDPTFTAHTYTIELQIYPLRDSGGFGPRDGPVLEFNTESDEEGWVGLVSVQRASISNTFYWHEYGLGPDGTGIPFLTVTAADGTYNRWYSIRIERVDDGTNTGATIKIYVDGTLVVNETLTYPQDARRGRIGNSIRYTYRRSSIDPQGAGVAIDNFKLTAGIAPSSVVDVSLANLQRNNANLLSFIKGKVPTVNDGTLTIAVNGATAGTFTANASTNATANITVPTAVSELTNDSGYLTSSSNLDASKLTSGTVDIERLPQGALERLVKVANEAARYALTTADVQLGDTVQQLDTGIMYVVTDIDHLDSAAGYTEYTAGAAASVPWSGVTGKPTFAAVATSGAYSDLTGTPTIPTVNDATLTIQQNGVNVQTFTANASTNATANIQCVDLTSAQTVAGNKTFSGIIGFTSSPGVSRASDPYYHLTTTGYDKGTTPASNMFSGVRFFCNPDASAANKITGGLDMAYYASGYNAIGLNARNYDENGSHRFFTVSLRVSNDSTVPIDFVPSVNQYINLGSSALQWNNAYIKSLAIDGVACGDILTHNVSEFVSVTGAQTIGGVKTFVNALTVTRPNVGTTGYVIKLTFKRGDAIASVNHSTFRVTDSEDIIVSEVCTENYVDGKVAQILNVRNTTDNGAQVQSSILHLLDKTGEQDWLYSVRNGKTYLGTSAYKWADVNTNLINGINPGALSLPSNSYVNVDTTNWDVAGGTNAYTPPANGWLHIRVAGATELMVRWTGWGFGDRRLSATATDLDVTIPVVAGVTVDVVTVASGFDGKCQFFPCQGNV